MWTRARGIACTAGWVHSFQPPAGSTKAHSISPSCAGPARTERCLIKIYARRSLWSDAYNIDQVCDGFVSKFICAVGLCGAMFAGHARRSRFPCKHVNRMAMTCNWFVWLAKLRFVYFYADAQIFFFLNWIRMLLKFDCWYSTSLLLEVSQEITFTLSASFIRTSTPFHVSKFIQNCSHSQLNCRPHYHPTHPQQDVRDVLLFPMSTIRKLCTLTHEQICGGINKSHR